MGLCRTCFLFVPSLCDRRENGKKQYEFSILRPLYHQQCAQELAEIKINNLLDLKSSISCAYEKYIIASIRFGSNLAATKCSVCGSVSVTRAEIEQVEEQMSLTIHSISVSDIFWLVCGYSCVKREAPNIFRFREFQS